MKTCSLVRGPSETLAYRDSGLSFPECTRMRLEDREQGLLCFGESGCDASTRDSGPWCLFESKQEIARYLASKCVSHGSSMSEFWRRRKRSLNQQELLVSGSHFSLLSEESQLRFVLSRNTDWVKCILFNGILKKKNNKDPCGRYQSLVSSYSTFLQVLRSL